MLCSRPGPLNATATATDLPDAQRERPSRVAGSFFGQMRSLELGSTPYLRGIGSGWSRPVRLQTDAPLAYETHGDRPASR